MIFFPPMYIFGYIYKSIIDGVYDYVIYPDLFVTTI